MGTIAVGFQLPGDGFHRGGGVVGYQGQQTTQALGGGKIIGLSFGGKSPPMRRPRQVVPDFVTDDQGKRVARDIGIAGDPAGHTDDGNCAVPVFLLRRGGALFVALPLAVKLQTKIPR